MSTFCSYLPPSRCRKREPPKKEKKISSGVSFLIPVSKDGQPKTLRKRKGGNLQKKTSINAKDLSIFHIDSQIQKKLETKFSTVSELQRDLSSLLWILQNSKNPTDRILASKRVNILRKAIQNLETSLELTLYFHRTSDIIEEYRQLVNSSGPCSFIGRKPEKDSIEERKEELIAQFLCVAKDYIEIENMGKAPEKIKCSSCCSIEFEFDERNSVYICKVCRTEKRILDDSPSFRDTDRVNMSSRFSYSRRGHFIEAMKKYQGVQNVDPQKIGKVVDVLLKQMELHGLTKETVTKDQLYMFLSERKLSKHYEDLNLLFHIITGVKCPNISHLEDKLLELFDQQEEKLAQILEDKRDNSLNVNYKLYKLLQRLGHPCCKDEFYILKTKAKEDEHDENLKKCWELLGWKWLQT